MESIVRTRKVGGSLTITLPKEIVKEEAIQEGELVLVNVKKVKKSYFGAARGVGPFTKEDELNTHE
ncbi:MAG: AbrB/MazE/SpoVT family DNA-binding domain-containing protein [Nanoarchaeota archaeon]